MIALGGILSGIFGGIAGGILNVIAGALESALNSMITALTTFWVDVGTPNLTSTAGGSTPSNAVSYLQSHLQWYMMAAAVTSIVLGCMRMAWEQHHGAGVEMLKGLLMFLAVNGAGLTVISLLVSASDAFSSWIVNGALTGTGGAAAAGSFGAAMGGMIGITLRCERRRSGDADHRAGRDGAGRVADPGVSVDRARRDVGDPDRGVAADVLVLDDGRGEAVVKAGDGVADRIHAVQACCVDRVRDRVSVGVRARVRVGRGLEHRHGDHVVVCGAAGAAGTDAVRHADGRRGRGRWWRRDGWRDGGRGDDGDPDRGCRGRRGRRERDGGGVCVGDASCERCGGRAGRWQGLVADHGEGR